MRPDLHLGLELWTAQQLGHPRLLGGSGRGPREVFWWIPRQSAADSYKNLCASRPCGRATLRPVRSSEAIRAAEQAESNGSVRAPAVLLLDGLQTCSSRPSTPPPTLHPSPTPPPTLYPSPSPPPFPHPSSLPTTLPPPHHPPHHPSPTHHLSPT